MVWRKRPPGLALIALALLVVCVYCKMVDVDCALHNPPHCQTVFENGDNDAAQLAFHCCHIAAPVSVTEVVSEIPRDIHEPPSGYRFSLLRPPPNPAAAPPLAKRPPPSG